MPKTFNTAKEAEAWLRANPMREVFDSYDYKNRFNDSEGYIEFLNKLTNEWCKDIQGIVQKNAPYTVIPQADKTITIDGKQYREGDVIDGTYTAQHELKKCHVEIVDVYCHSLDLKILHIPDELADKPEPKTLTLEELTGDSKVCLIHPITGDLSERRTSSFGGYDIIHNHASRGHKLYASRDDAERGKALGWS